MEWSGQKEFVSSPEVPFTVDDSEAGLLKTYGPLSFLKVCNPLHAQTSLWLGKMITHFDILSVKNTGS